jgi:hypothetical protein
MESGLSSGTSFGRKKRIEVAIGAAATGLLLLGMIAANILRKGEVNYEKINLCPSTNGQFARYRCCAKNLILGISTICLRLNFSRRLDLDQICLFLDGH